MLFTEVIKLLPGFRFRPTDEELVSYYLKRKVLGRLFPFEVIAEVDLYKYEPWDLPEKSALPTRDLEWYFFIPRDRKYPNGFRTNRATAKGYWKSTGKDRSVSSGSRVAGTKKTLVYYNGRAPKGERTNWVMHEYRLSDVECQKIRAVENGFVLCRVYQKSGVGPKNGEQYGAPVEDDDFEDSPTLEVDGCDSLKLELMERGPSSQNTLLNGSLTAQDDDGCVSFGIDVAGQYLSFSGFEPRNLNVDFEKLYGDLQPNSTQNFFCRASRDVLLVANREVLDRVVAPPVTLEDEAEILEQLLGDCTNHLNSTDGYHNNSIFVEDGCYQTGAKVPSDGGFLELDDLVSVSDSEEDKTSANNNARNAIIGLKDYAEEAQGFVMQALPTFDACEAWENTFSKDALCEGEQVLAEVMEMQPTVSYDFGQEPFRKNMLGCFPPPLADYNEDIGPAGPTQPIAPEDGNDMKMLNHLHAYVNEKEFLDYEGSPELLVQELGYFDAVPLFTDIDACVESTNTKLDGCKDHGSPEVTLAASQWANKFNEVLDDRNLKAKDEGGSSQGQAVCLEPERRSPSSLSLFFRLMDSLPTLPASAAELSPKATSPSGSIHLTTTGIAMGSVSVTCTCIGETVPSSCVNCSVTEAEKKGHFVRSMSFLGRRKKPLNRWDMGMLISAVSGALLAVFFGVLVASGAWKGLGGVCKLISLSKT